MEKYVIQEIPKCLDDNLSLEAKLVKIDFKNDPNYIVHIHYCKKCEKYLGTKKMEKGIKKAALDEYNFLSMNKRKIKDIKKVEIADKNLY